jgi:hypothetical protein
MPYVFMLPFAFSCRTYLQTAWDLLLLNAKLDPCSKIAIFRSQQNHQKGVLSLWKNYAREQKIAKVLEKMKRSSSIHFLFQQWKHSAFKASQERPQISMVSLAKTTPRGYGLHTWFIDRPLKPI